MLDYLDDFGNLVIGCRKFSSLNLTPEQVRLVHEYIALTDRMREAKIQLVKEDDVIVALSNLSGRLMTACDFYSDRTLEYDDCHELHEDDLRRLGMSFVDFLDVWDNSNEYQPVYVRDEKYSGE